MDRLHPSKYRDPVWDTYASKASGKYYSMEKFYNAYVEAKHIKHVLTDFHYAPNNEHFLLNYRYILEVEPLWVDKGFVKHAVAFEGQCETWEILTYITHCSTEQILTELDECDAVKFKCAAMGIKISILENASWHNGASLIEFDSGLNEPWKPYDFSLRCSYFDEFITSRVFKLPVDPQSNMFHLKEIPVNIVTFTGDTDWLSRVRDFYRSEPEHGNQA